MHMYPTQTFRWTEKFFQRGFPENRVLPHPNKMEMLRDFKGTAQLQKDAEYGKSRTIQSHLKYTAQSLS